MVSILKCPVWCLYRNFFISARMVFGRKSPGRLWRLNLETWHAAVSFRVYGVNGGWSSLYSANKITDFFFIIWLVFNWKKNCVIDQRFDCNRAHLGNCLSLSSIVSLLKHQLVFTKFYSKCWSHYHQVDEEWNFAGGVSSPHRVNWHEEVLRIFEHF